MSRVLPTSSERFHHIKIHIQKLSTVYPGLWDKTWFASWRQFWKSSRQHSIFGRIGDQWVAISSPAWISFFSRKLQPRSQGLSTSIETVGTRFWKLQFLWLIGNRTEWSPIRSVIILVINKSYSLCAVVRYSYHSYDYRPNWTLLSPITITNSGSFFLPLSLSLFHWLSLIMIFCLLPHTLSRSLSLRASLTRFLLTGFFLSLSFSSFLVVRHIKKNCLACVLAVFKFFLVVSKMQYAGHATSRGVP